MWSSEIASEAARGVVAATTSSYLIVLNCHSTTRPLDSIRRSVISLVTAGTDAARRASERAVEADRSTMQNAIRKERDWRGAQFAWSAIGVERDWRGRSGRERRNRGYRNGEPESKPRDLGTIGVNS